MRASSFRNPEVDIGTGVVTLSDILEEETEVKISIIGEKAEHKEAVEEKTQERSSTSTYIEWNTLKVFSITFLTIIIIVQDSDFCFSNPTN